MGKVQRGDGLAPLPWSEIEAFARITGDIQTRLEMVTLRKMSVAYIEGLRLGEDVFAEPPMVTDL